LLYNHVTITTSTFIIQGYKTAMDKQMYIFVGVPTEISAIM